jgi:predicted ATP-dependent serine protease
MKKPISAQNIREKVFHVIPFEGDWATKYGQPEQSFSAMFYGPPGSGKSTEVLKFCEYLAQNFGAVCYNSCEEGISKTLQDTVINANVKSNRIYFYDSLTFPELMETLKKGKHKFAVIDSAQYMRLTYSQYQELRKAFPKKGIIIVSQVNGRGNVHGGQQMLHAMDIKANINAGLANIRSRYIKGGHVEFRLFGGKKQSVQQSLDL